MPATAARPGRAGVTSVPGRRARLIWLAGIALPAARLSTPPLQTAGAHQREQRPASWLELFFDLVFAGAIGQLAGALQDHPGPVHPAVHLDLVAVGAVHLLHRPARVRRCGVPGRVLVRDGGMRGPGRQRAARAVRPHHRVHCRGHPAARPAAAAVRPGKPRWRPHTRRIQPASQDRAVLAGQQVGVAGVVPAAAVMQQAGPDRVRGRVHPAQPPRHALAPGSRRRRTPRPAPPWCAGWFLPTPASPATSTIPG